MNKRILSPLIITMCLSPMLYASAAPSSCAKCTSTYACGPYKLSGQCYLKKTIQGKTIDTWPYPQCSEGAVIKAGCDNSDTGQRQGTLRVTKLTNSKLSVLGCYVQEEPGEPFAPVQQLVIQGLYSESPPNGMAPAQCAPGSTWKAKPD